MPHSHTPGPWIFASPTSRTVGYGITTTGFPVHVAVASHNDASEANARLIAAAPELLEALQAMFDAFWRHSLTAHELATVEAASAALLKATGEQ